MPDDLKIRSSADGLGIAVSVYTENWKSSNRPVIVMGHGIGAIKTGGLPAFAKRYNEKGYAAVTFDYRSFGDSEGDPRQVMAVSEELQDFRDVIAWVRSQPDRFARDKIVVWGSSFGGMHVSALMSEDHDLCAGIMQCPCVDGFASVYQTPINRSLRLAPHIAWDLLRSLFNLPPSYVDLTSDGAPDSPVAFMASQEVIRGWKYITPAEGPFSNIIAARSVLSIALSRPVYQLYKSKRPLLVVLTTHDHEASLPAAELAVEIAPLGEAWRVDGGHFDLYAGGPSYEKNLEGQLAFLKRVLSN